MTATLDLKTVLTAIPKAGATNAQIAAKFDVSSRDPKLHHLLTRLVVGGLASMTFEGGRVFYKRTARARRMAGSTDEQLATWIAFRLSSADSLPGGGAR